MDITTYATDALIDELDRRGLITVVSATQRIDGVQFSHNLGRGDELRVTALRMAQLMAGRAVADDVDLHHATTRRMKTTASEDITVAVLCVKSSALRSSVETSEKENGNG